MESGSKVSVHDLNSIAAAGGRHLKNQTLAGELRNARRFKVRLGRGSGSYLFYCGEMYATQGMCRCGLCEGVCGPYTGCQCIFCMDYSQVISDGLVYALSQKSGVPEAKIKEDSELAASLWMKSLDYFIQFCDCPTADAQGREPSEASAPSEGALARVDDWEQAQSVAARFSVEPGGKVEDLPVWRQAGTAVTAVFWWILHLFFSTPMVLHSIVAFFIWLLCSWPRSLAIWLLWFGTLFYIRGLHVALEDVPAEMPRKRQPVQYDPLRMIMRDKTLLTLVSDPTVDRDTALALERLQHQLWDLELENRIEQLAIELVQKYLDENRIRQAVVKSITISKMKLGGTPPKFRKVKARRQAETGPGRSVLILDVENEFHPDPGTMRVEIKIVFHSLFPNVSATLFLKDMRVLWKAAIILPTSKEPPFFDGKHVKVLLTDVPVSTFEWGAKLGKRDVNASTLLPFLGFVQDKAVNAAAEHILRSQLPLTLVDSVMTANADIPGICAHCACNTLYRDSRNEPAQDPVPILSLIPFAPLTSTPASPATGVH